jgi:antitoxin (DNA-binding transcriptional repressor) of toxin-antitoxin stability system
MTVEEAESGFEALIRHTARTWQRVTVTEDGVPVVVIVAAAERAGPGPGSTDGRPGTDRCRQKAPGPTGPGAFRSTCGASPSRSRSVRSSGPP